MSLFLDDMDLGCTSDEEKITAGSNTSYWNIPLTKCLVCEWN